MRMRSGAYWSSTFSSALPKSPTRLQQMQPEFISVIWMPASLRKPPSMPISPNSFSMSTSFSPPNASLMSFLMRVVLPAPRKPEKISIFVICNFPSFCQILRPPRPRQPAGLSHAPPFYYIPAVNRPGAKKGAFRAAFRFLPGGPKPGLRLVRAASFPPAGRSPPVADRPAEALPPPPKTTAPAAAHSCRSLRPRPLYPAAASAVDETAGVQAPFLLSNRFLRIRRKADSTSVVTMLASIP